MRRVLRRQGPREGAVVIQSTSEIEKERISSQLKKPFRCLVGGGGREHFSDDDYADLHDVMSPEDQYVPPGENIEYGFEATLQESKKKKHRARSFRKHKEKTKEHSDSLSLTRNRSLEELPPPESARQLEPYAFPRNGSFESLPPGVELDALVRSRSRSFAEAIPPGKKNDPLDSESIRDVSKALREMERKLEAAGTEGKKVSRTKVMKALLTVVDQLQDEEDYGPMLTPPLPPSNNTSVNTSNTSSDLFNKWATSDAEAVALDRQRRNLEQMRELTITPNKDHSMMMRSESPWKGDKPSFSKLNEELKAASTEETEADPEYISSSSDEEEETIFSEDTKESKRVEKKHANEKGSFSHAVYDEATIGQTTTEGTLESEDSSFFPPPRKGKSRKGSFAHAVSPSAARKNPRNKSLDMFSLDMKDPAVHDALADLLWIPSPNKTIAPSTAKPAVVSPSEPSPAKSDEPMRTNDSMNSYNGEDEYYTYDQPDIGEETTEATTQSSFSAASQPKKKAPRESSWWKRRNGASLKPSSKDTPIVQEQPRHIQTKVTVTQQYSDLDPWQEDHHRWEEH